MTAIGKGNQMQVLDSVISRTVWDYFILLLRSCWDFLIMAMNIK